MPLDATTPLAERAGRWLAARSSRRSFLGRAGKFGIVAAGGTLISQVFSERADARVCGQSGISPKCPTYDCFAPSVWGWCWYAGNASCCADGGLKKICDCCRANHPNVHGYCPEGANVYCVVESCLEDPRVMKVKVVSYPQPTAAGIAVGRTSSLANGGVVTAVIAHPDDRLMAALATPVAAHLNAVVLTTPLDSIAGELPAELARLGVSRIVVVGSGFGAGVIAGLGALPGISSVAHLGTTPSVDLASIEVARWLITNGAQPKATVIGASAGAVLLAPAAGAFAAMQRGVVVVTPEAAGALRAEIPALSFTFAGDVSGSAGAGDATFPGTDPFAVARSMVQNRLDVEPAAAFALALTIGHDRAFSNTLVQPGSLALLHQPDQLDPELRDWLIARRSRFDTVHVATGGRDGMGDARIHDLQSAVNGFQCQLLVGSDGMGLPVIPQPNEEKVLGKARVSGPAPSTTKPLSKRTKVTTSTTTAARSKQAASAPTTSAPATTVATTNPTVASTTSAAPTTATAS